MRLSRQGFSLIEILIAIVLTGMMLSVFYAVLMGSWVDFETNNAHITMQQEGLRAMANLEEDILEARSAAVSNGGQTLTLTYPAVPFLTGFTTFGAVSPFYAGTVVYTIAGGNLMKAAAGGVPVPVTAEGYLDASSVFSVDRKTVRCQLFFRTDVFGKTVHYDMDNTYQCRN